MTYSNSGFSLLVYPKYRKPVIAIGIILILFIVWLSFPLTLFQPSYATILTDSEGKLLSAQIAPTGQWQFPSNPNIPEKFENAIVQFEDQYFYWHPGVNPVSIARAIKQNYKTRRIVSGGSTITMQVARLLAQNKNRNIWSKLHELFLALKIELHYSKSEILAMYSSNAPFGGNVVGLHAASWRYYGRDPNLLSWAESATLAVLPNTPSLIFPGKNHHLLLAKRNRLLDKLQRHHIIDSVTCALAKAEPLPSQPKPLPRQAPHLLTRAITEGFQGTYITSTLDGNLQTQVNQIIDKHARILSLNQINNVAAIVVEVNSGNILAYVGNSNASKNDMGQQVDMVTSKRSPGSTLKPILYALMQNDGLILPNALVPDIPTHIAGYAPKNFNSNYAGAVPASDALSQSLNIPAVRQLQDYGIERFHLHLKSLGLSTLNQSAGHYGLSIILGGSEATMNDLAQIYTGMARSLNQFQQLSGKYYLNNYRKLQFTNIKSPESNPVIDHPILSAGAIYLTFEALKNMERPTENNEWQKFYNSKTIAWKTGTSFGHRDAWAIGITPQYVVVVWVGNASGEGRPGLTGIAMAAPIMFDIFNQLPKTDWFAPPYDNLIKTPVCQKSGYKASPYCNTVDSVYITPNGLRTAMCPYHKPIQFDADALFRVNASCYTVHKMTTKNCFILPPVMEWYYKQKNPEYQLLPPLLKGCQDNSISNMAFIYPEPNAKIFIPVDLEGRTQKTVLEVAHRTPGVTIYWHLDNTFLGSTKGLHKMEVNPSPGPHRITLVDEVGEVITSNFVISEKD